ncbi:transporter, major intrinsic protein (MIP) superfamily protein [Acanthamoeba castellanii str. Neff]|uniref:Transporter, major intrinsic protein (MIP) superfamily protein n=1 Tax=Acanthamoeba castellanii (strain ATCC 30010 / Neff) TaxID=1257118 RepID=L8H0X2_ACACF|nr:transporter, major intrinsic protein (MIP) superfamily protein [Acanthamoeba castellanii str. Neff]ELR18905.1 transporter, major intrinsic protein (MIP) superfamily protein [Acanthamoeba castellanii str. Neff]
MEEMDFCEYLPGGKSHERCQGRLAEFRRGMAEAIGTFALVLVSCLASASPYSTDISKSLAVGMLVMGLVFSIGQVSGAHFNPAVSVAFSLRFAFQWWRLLYYIPAQFGDVGASLPEGMTSQAALGLEIAFSSIFLFIVLNVAERAKVVGPNGALATGLALIALATVGGPLGGTSMNPFRSLAPALLAGGKALDEVWLFIVGPLVGAVIAVLLTFLLGSRVHPLAYHKATGIGRSGPEDVEELLAGDQEPTER